jgi:hypothetical protein
MLHCIVNVCMLTGMQYFQNAHAYFVTVVNYECKMFNKLTPRARIIKFEDS